MRLLLRLAGAFLAALLLSVSGGFLLTLLLSLAVPESVRDALTIPTTVVMPGLAFGYLFGRFLEWLAWRAARYEERQGWRDWPEYRTALKRDEARRKAIRSQRP